MLFLIAVVVNFDRCVKFRIDAGLKRCSLSGCETHWMDRLLFSCLLSLFFDRVSKIVEYMCCVYKIIIYETICGIVGVMIGWYMLRCV